MMPDRYFVGINGNMFVVPDAPQDYTRTDGATLIGAPPSPEHRWIAGKWQIPDADPIIRHRVPKQTMVLRLTEEEANTFMADLNDAPGKLSLLWNSIMNIDDRDEYYPILKGIIESRLSPERAAEVLAPTE